MHSLAIVSLFLVVDEIQIIVAVVWE